MPRRKIKSYPAWVNIEGWRLGWVEEHKKYARVTCLDGTHRLALEDLVTKECDPSTAIKLRKRLGK